MRWKNIWIKIYTFFLLSLTFNWGILFSCLIIHSRLNIDKSCLQQSKEWRVKNRLAFKPSSLTLTLRNQVFRLPFIDDESLFIDNLFLPNEEDHKFLMTSNSYISSQLSWYSVKILFKFMHDTYLIFFYFTFFLICVFQSLIIIRAFKVPIVPEKIFTDV